ncbi:hypothetical protein J4212_02820 [Candidatus Woesearchaeota archaeon]|nr:hypothetical protein [Candidatus Woesearchaeota archaeon]
MKEKDKIEIISDLKRDSFSEFSLVNNEFVKYVAISSLFVAVLSLLLNIFQKDQVLETLSLIVLFILMVTLLVAFIWNYSQINRIREDIVSHYKSLQRMLITNEKNLKK